ncbi:hypothetical protein JKP88DRAFT_215836 [Tribonema minus]|uniref:Uncharacterized protein n=1 Tax=Tribonema minus TaxID=303371 RepID=A0A835YS83_9STRA|nr:hypothetical protein JKP88DRAFT_215836 [Tribonema minus]
MPLTGPSLWLTHDCGGLRRWGTGPHALCAAEGTATCELEWVTFLERPSCEGRFFGATPFLRQAGDLYFLFCFHGSFGFSLAFVFSEFLCFGVFSLEFVLGPVTSRSAMRAAHAPLGGSSTATAQSKVGHEARDKWAELKQARTRMMQRHASFGPSARNCTHAPHMRWRPPLRIPRASLVQRARQRSAHCGDLPLVTGGGVMRASARGRSPPALAIAAARNCFIVCATRGGARAIRHRARTLIRCIRARLSIRRAYLCTPATAP